MPTPTDDDRSLLTVIASMRAAPGKRDELRSALEELVPTTLAELTTLRLGGPITRLVEATGTAELVEAVRCLQADQTNVEQIGERGEAG